VASDAEGLLLKVERISKAFGGVQALTDVNLELDRASVHAIVGHNGAGKSTLMNVVSGTVQPDAGRLLLNGKEVILREPRQAQQHGISMVHQELSVLGDLNITENIFLGREPITRAGLVDRTKADRAARELLDRLHLNLPERAICSRLSVGERQMVEIARAVSWDAKVVILDEPTAALSDTEQNALFELIARLKASGIGILYISHRLDEILLLADTVSVFRDGKNAGEVNRGNFDHSTLVEMMLGHSVEKVSSPAASKADKALQVNELSSRGAGLEGITFSVSTGEIVGLAGMLGSGRSELFECIFGMLPFERGSITLKGLPLRIRTPMEAMNKRIGLVPEDRKVQGIFPGTALWKNVTLASLHDLFSNHGFIKEREARAATAAQIAKLQIRAHSVDQDISFLSGGNQQKGILARWILRDPEVLLLDDPTAGIDIGAKTEIYELIRNLASQGVAILLSSSEFDELIGLCHRILVMRDGKIINEVDGSTANEHSLVLLATGGGHE